MWFLNHQQQPRLDLTRNGPPQAIPDLLSQKLWGWAQQCVNWLALQVTVMLTKAWERLVQTRGDGCLHLRQCGGQKGMDARLRQIVKSTETCVCKGGSREEVQGLWCEWLIGAQEYTTPSRLWGLMSYVLDVGGWSCLWAMQLVRLWHTWVGSSEESFHVTSQSRRPETELWRHQYQRAEEREKPTAVPKTEKEKQKEHKRVLPEPLVLPQGIAKQVLF